LYPKRPAGVYRGNAPAPGRAPAARTA